MKKLLIVGSLSTVLFLAACGTTEEDDTEETREESTDESSELATENEELKEQNQQLQEQIESLEEELVAVEETESADAEAEEIETAEESTEGMENIKEVTIEETIDIENIKLTIHKAQINRIDVNEDLAIFLDDHEVGDKVDNLVIEYTLENTTEAPRTFYLDQSVIVTSTGQQIEPDLIFAEGIETNMLGAISSTGTVPYIMDEGAGDDIEWVDVNFKSILDAESYERVAEESTYRIEF